MSEKIVLTGSRCRECDTVGYPAGSRCGRCGSETDPTELSRQGTVWAYTVQRFAPKSPPYVPPSSGFQPYAMGYVELPEGVKVTAVLDSGALDGLAGARAVLVAAEPVPRFAITTTPETGVQ
ncbi:OB-fold domain-containing protein [Gordonia sp. HY002]|uniref:Zn-ribbon domain-containing OB-fold protein n=1 Tax=Gordonia zhenghanii TaxID=2911516 RepID=UPI001EF0824B|nr:OB-fold domain-containing protein [Gordonia zhenghanii]MCF8571918.1 OB-fold domain-containing protein [Gordonia zhenghanii]MCF8605898.1 OB-fold domain-containing protein [Gordonia zhenghanii]